MSNSIIVIGDIHGCYYTLQNLLKLLPHNNLCFVGDLVDRGAHSRKVIEFIRDNNYDCVIGNHELMMIHPKHRLDWAFNGAGATLRNYKSSSKDSTDKDLLKKDIKWIKDNLMLYYLYEDIKDDQDRALLVTHSIASPNWWKAVNDPKQMKSKSEMLINDITWNRNFHKIKPIPGIFNIFGHTVQEKGPRIRSSFACIDTGAVYNGKLTAIQYPSLKTWSVGRDKRDVPILD